MVAPGGGIRRRRLFESLLSGALHAKSNRRTKGLSLSDPRVRVAVPDHHDRFRGRSGLVPVHNTQTNLQHRGITSGFDFLERSAGFGIAQHLIDYTESDSYARVFVIGLLNTLLVTFIGVILATILGFIIGVARLSPNWMINKLATVYVETFRNIPPLLQILFWYFAVFLTMPGPRGSINFDDTFFISSRGLNMPAPMADGFWPLSWRGGGLVAIAVMVRWANKRFDATGVPFHKFWAGLALFLVIPALSVLLFGSRCTGKCRSCKGFNFVGGWVLIPELLALTLALTVYTAAFIAEIVRRHPFGQPRPDRSGALARPARRPDPAQGDHPAGAAGDHSAADQPVPEPGEELVAGGRYRLPGNGLAVRRYRAQPDRPGHRGDRHHHERVPGHQHQHFAADELVQQAHCADRAVRIRP
jgi:general L-amino acid transport system permease protein